VLNRALRYDTSVNDVAETRSGWRVTTLRAHGPSFARRIAIVSLKQLSRSYPGVPTAVGLPMGVRRPPTPRSRSMRERLADMRLGRTAAHA
jgi:hypothetical protein